MKFSSSEEHSVIAEMYPTALVQYPQSTDGSLDKFDYDFKLMLQTDQGNVAIGNYTLFGNFLPIDNCRELLEVVGQEVIDKYATIIKDLSH